jgi:integrase
MLKLPNNCKASEPKVTPSTWARLNASIKKDWRIWYRFYDPAHKAKYPKGKMVSIKGMNEYKTLASRQSVTKALLEEELSLLQTGYNPHVDKIVAPNLETFIVAPTTYLLAALQTAYELITRAKCTKDDLKCTLVKVAPYWIKCHLHTKEIGKVTKRDLKSLQAALLQGGECSNNRINKLLGYLSTLFTELEEMEAIDLNPWTGIKKLAIVKKIRQTLTIEERIAVYEHLAKVNPVFRRFMHIFFHAGSRVRELLAVQKKHVDLKAQKVKYTVLKGGRPHEVIRPLKTIALPFWIEVLAICGPDDFLFSEGLAPGPQEIRREQIGRRWNTWVKDTKRGLGITADFYSIRHSNLDEVTNMLSMKEAAKLAGHSNTRMLEQHYAVGEEARAQERLREVHNPFA